VAAHAANNPAIAAKIARIGHRLTIGQRTLITAAVEEDKDTAEPNEFDPVHDLRILTMLAARGAHRLR
jgi:hypothetical protein